MLWLYAGQIDQAGRPQNRVNGELGGVVAGRGKLVQLRGLATLGIAGDLILEIGDRRGARQQLAVVEGDAVIAGQQAEARLGPGGHLRPVALAVDRAGGYQVLVEHGLDDVDIGGDIQVRLVEQVVDRRL